jgi:hypothetical protein
MRVGTAPPREAGFGVDHGRIVDVSGQCPGFATLPTFNKGAVDRDATLSKVLCEFITARRVSGSCHSEGAIATAIGSAE